jgi:hypothetical protein
MLQCIAAPTNQEDFKLAVVKVLIKVTNEHTWFWSKLRAGSSPANKARHVTAGDTDSHMHSSPYEYYIMYAALMKEMQVNRVRGPTLDTHTVGPTDRAMHQVDQCLPRCGCLC